MLVLLVRVVSRHTYLQKSYFCSRISSERRRVPALLHWVGHLQSLRLAT